MEHRKLSLLTEVRNKGASSCHSSPEIVVEEVSVRHSLLFLSCNHDVDVESHRVALSLRPSGTGDITTHATKLKTTNL